MNTFSIATCSPFGLADPGVPIAGTRAGATGILDLEYAAGFDAALRAVSHMARYAASDFGVTLAGRHQGWLPRLAGAGSGKLKMVILGWTDGRRLEPAIQNIHHHRLKALVQVASLEEALDAERLGADILIVKGNEAGGRVGDETTFILLQRILGGLEVPIWAHGGVGLHTAAACRASGAAGVVLDAQLSLTRESSLPSDLREIVARMDGTETRCVGGALGEVHRLYGPGGSPAVDDLSRFERRIASEGPSTPDARHSWREAVRQRIRWQSGTGGLVPMGQDVCFAPYLADRFVTVGGVVEAVRRSIDNHCHSAGKRRWLAQGAPLAQSHGTRFPIVQGPMARVSDSAVFIASVARGGGLPFVAAAWMRGDALVELLRKTRELVAGRPWGVGLLGFLPPEVYREQVDTLLAHRPPFALIAGAQPGQMESLESHGIETYVHVATPGMLDLFLGRGAKRFVFEGREAGGHVGPLSSFVLWETMIQRLRAHIAVQGGPEAYHVLFAGGIHDARSAAMVGVMAAVLAEQGVRLGVQLGSAYLFTAEAVDTGAVIQGFSERALQAAKTTLLESGPGQAVRCLDNPFARAFHRERHRLLDSGVDRHEIRQALERMQIGRLRIASKGLRKGNGVGRSAEPTADRLVPVGESEQWDHGLYMMGQVVALVDRRFSIDDLHRDVSAGGTDRMERLAETPQRDLPESRKAQPMDIAIVGMACLLPKATDVQLYWENIVNRVNAVQEVPRERWDWRRYYDPDKHAPDKIYSKWGAFVDGVLFDPTRYGMPPRTLDSIEPLHLLTLETARQALTDAGYADRPFPRERTSVILGISGSGELGQQYGFRTALPTYFGADADRIIDHFQEALPEWTEDSFPGILMNVSAGRVANRLDLGGVNCTVDAACASALSAVYVGAKELTSGTSDMVVVGGGDCMQNPFTYMCFSKTQALSPGGRCNSLDDNADGIVLGEGIAVVILKRLADAERDGDRIYAVIKGIGASSDGREKSLTAPARRGQVRALRRAYRTAGYSPATVGLIEAHATGTSVGDRVEVESLSDVFQDAGARTRSCAIGSVKSMIGHTKSTAGLASLIKAVLSLHHKVLPPTLGVTQPNRALLVPQSPFYVNPEPRPWLAPVEGHPRRAGVSAFGFGGTNFHVALEGYDGDFLGHQQLPSRLRWPAELVLLEGDTETDLIGQIDRLQAAVSEGSIASPADCLRWLAHTRSSRGSASGPKTKTIAIVAGNLEELGERLASAGASIQRGVGTIWDPKGVYFSETPLAAQGKVAFVFPGQGSQHVGMLADLAVEYPAVRERFEQADRVLGGTLAQPLSAYVFPAHRFDAEAGKAADLALADTQVAQPAMGAADLALFHLLGSFGIRPDMVAGHSYGEYVALCAAGVLSDDDLIRLSEARARFIREAVGPDPGTMAAVNTGAETLASHLVGIEGVWIANLNCPDQTVITGTQQGVTAAVDRLTGKGLQARRIPVSCAFHSPLVAKAGDPLRSLLSTMTIHAPAMRVYANLDGEPYPGSAEAVVDRLVDHLTGRVEFTREIEAMYRDGARIFVEVGPGRVLTGLVHRILGDRPHLAASSNLAGRCGLTQLQHLLGQLAAHGVRVNGDGLRRAKALTDCVAQGFQTPSMTLQPVPTAWLVSGGKAQPYDPATASRGADADFPKDITMSLKTIGPSGGKPVVDADTPSPIAVDPGPSRAAPADPQPRVHRPPAPAGISGHHKVEGVMARYQQLMQRFLQTQETVMLAYLGQEPAHRPATAVRDDVAPLPFVPADPTPAVCVLPPARPQTPDAPEVAGPRAQAQVHEPEAPGPETPADPEGWKRELLAIVSSRTGYPQEMIDLDADLEADLGIDSIKRVEILGHFLQQVLGAGQGDLPVEMGNWIGLKTLREVLQQTVSSAGGLRTDGPEPRTDGTPASAPDPSPEAAGTPPLPRFSLKPIAAPSSPLLLDRATGGVLVITEDGRGISGSLGEKLTEKGYAVAYVRTGAPTGVIAPNAYTLEDVSADAVARLVDEIRRHHGPVGGLVHLMPLSPWVPHGQMDLKGWRDRLHRDVGSFFHLLQFLAGDLRRAAGQGGGCVLSATGMAGSFAMEAPQGQDGAFPGHGAIPGLLKSLALEWPEVRFKSVDLWLEAPLSKLVECLVSELHADDGLLEVGYDPMDRRLCVGLTEAPLEAESGIAMEMDASWVLLVTGGAQGITAKVAAEIAARHRPTLILVGRSPLPTEPESKRTAGLKAPEDIKRALIDDREGRQEPVRFTEINAACDRLLKDRAIRDNLAALRRTGARVEYVSADVRDESRLGGLIDGIYETHGRLDGVIHGAGVIEDKRFEDKTWDSFSRVFGTKTESAFILSKRLRKDALKFILFFSSIAGRFGNVGQSDYTAANDVVNKLACLLDATWPGRVCAINWGPWSGGGMATETIQTQFAQRGIRPIPSDSGAAYVCDELLRGRKGQAEVVVGEGPWQKLASVQARLAGGNTGLPLLERDVQVAGTNGRLEVVRRFDPGTDRYLLDHCLDGKPVLPAAMAVEFMVQAAALGWPASRVTAIRDVRVFKGVVFEDGPRHLRLALEAKPGKTAEGGAADVGVTLTDPSRPAAPLYSATVGFAIDASDFHIHAGIQHHDLQPFATAEEAYDNWLFHGPKFQCIHHIHGISKTGMAATLMPSSPVDCLGDRSKGQWLVDPVVLDGGLQLALLWARHYLDITVLPSHFKAVHIFRPMPPGQEIDCRLRVVEVAGNQTVYYDIFFIDPLGHPLAIIERVEATGSRALNRLVGQRSDGARVCG